MVVGSRGGGDTLFHSFRHNEVNQIFLGAMQICNLAMRHSINSSDFSKVTKKISLVFQKTQINFVKSILFSNNKVCVSTLGFKAVCLSTLGLVSKVCLWTLVFRNRKF